MVRQNQRSLPELLDLYRDYLLSKVSKVRILGEADERELKDVFVELSIVDQRAPQQHAEFLGLMGSAMRRRFNPFADVDREDAAPEKSGAREKETKHRVRPDELLRRRTKAIITGSPGCGKTTLLKYLALQAQEQERLAVWLELKAIDRPLFAQAEAAAARNGHLILPELWLKHLQTQLSLSAADIQLLRAHWQEKFQAHEIVVLLDGFDELQDEAIQRSLNKCVGQFASALHDNTLLISTRPYAQARLGHERLQELEIEPLNQRQIEAFLNCYYPNDAATKSLLKTLRERSSLRELLHVPLLLGVVLRLHKENSFTDERLKLYEAIIADLIHKLDRSKSVTRQFKINDEGLRLDFLKFLAFERLLRDRLDEEEQEANRIVFSYDLLKEKARMFLAKEYPSHNPRDLANDALATPLLREVGADTYAFTHLTLQEYLAARAFAAFYQKKGNEFEGLKIFCRAYHNPTMVEMEVLPMMLGALSNAENLYAEIERWPESLTFANLRLRARGLAHSAKMKHDRLSNMIDRLFEFIPWKDSEETPYREIVINSFAGMSRQAMSLIETRAASFLRTDAGYFHFGAAELLGRIGSGKAIEALIAFLQTEDRHRQWCAAEVLGRLGLDKAVDPLIAALRAQDSNLRCRAAKALGRIGSETAVEAFIAPLRAQDSNVRQTTAEAFIEALQDQDSKVRQTAAEALGQLGSDTATEALILVLQDKDSEVRCRAAKALGQLGSDTAVDPLVAALQDENVSVLKNAAEALYQIGSPKAADKTAEALGAALQHEDRRVRRNAIEAYGQIDSDTAVEAFIAALQHENSGLRRRAVEALGQLGSDTAVGALIAAFQDEDSEVPWMAASELWWIEFRSGSVVGPLIAALQHENSEVRWMAVKALLWIGSDIAVGALFAALQDENSEVRRSVAESLGLPGSNTAINTLIAALQHENSYVRRTAAEELRQLGSDTAVEALIAALQDEDEKVRWSVAQALAQLGSDAAIDTLIAALQDEDREVRQRAGEALAQIGSDTAFDALFAALQNKDGAHWKVAEALGQIGSDTAFDVLIAALQDESSEVRQSVAESLGRLGSDKVVDPLIAALRDQDGAVRWTAAQGLGQIGSEKAVDSLIVALQDEDGYVRWMVAEALGLLGSDRGVETLKAALQDEDRDLRGRTVVALEQIGSDTAVAALITALQDEDGFVRGRAAQALAQIRVEVLVSGLVRTVKQRDVFARKKAVSVIAYYSDDERTLEQLKQLSQRDSDREIRATASEAAEKFARKLELLGHFIAEGLAQPLNDNESRELFLVGEAFKVVAEAGYIFRPTGNSDWGIDGEIEFKNDRGEASGKRVYLQLKSGDSHLRKRKSDGKEIFTIKQRHAEYWQSHAYPVFLVIRNTGGQTRWMNVTEYLQRHGTKIKQIEFQSEPFTAESVKQMRDRLAI